MMVRIFILKASVKKEGMWQTCARAGGPEAYSRRESAAIPVFLNRRHWLVSGNRVTTEKRKEKGKERKGDEHLDQRLFSSFRPLQSGEQLSVII